MGIKMGTLATAFISKNIKAEDGSMFRNLLNHQQNMHKTGKNQSVAQLL